MTERKGVGHFYIRFSTLAQGVEGRDSRRRQRVEITRLAKEYGIEVDENNFYEDLGVSAYSGKNQKKGSALFELIDKINTLQLKKGDFIIIESIDRLSRRRLSEIKKLVNGILEKGINILTTIDKKLYTPKSVDDLADQMIISLIASRSFEESKVKAERVRAANATKRRLADEGNPVLRKANLPYGIVLNEDAREYEIDKQKRLEVVYLFEMMKNYGVFESVKRVKEKYPESKLSVGIARYFIDSKCVIGYYHAQKREDGRKVSVKHIPNIYPKLIKTSSFNIVLEKLKDRKKGGELSGRRNVYDYNIFKGVLSCACCNSNMIFEKGVIKHRNLEVYYYNCRNRKEKNLVDFYQTNGMVNSVLCPSERVRLEYIFAAFLKIVFNAKTDMVAFRREGKLYKKSHYDVPKIKLRNKKVFKKIIKTGYRLEITDTAFKIIIKKGYYSKAKSLLTYYKDTNKSFYLEELVADPILIEALNMYENELVVKNSIYLASKELQLKAVKKYLTEHYELEEDLKPLNYDEVSAIADKLIPKSEISGFLKLLEVNYAKEIEDSFKQSLLHLFNAVEERAVSDEIEDLVSQLEIANNNIKNQKSKLVSYLEKGTDIPDVIYEIITQYERVRNDLEVKISKLNVVAEKNKVSVDIKDNEEFLKLFRTREGRVKINDYFIRKGITINVRFYTEIRALEVDLRIATGEGKGNRIGYLFHRFPLKLPLREFLGKEIGTIRDLVDVEEKQFVYLSNKEEALINY